MNAVDVVIDTNVLVSALRSKKGASYKLLMALPDNRYRPNVSVPLFVEYEAVAKREELIDGLRANDNNSILNYFLRKSSIRKIFYLWRPHLKDPKEDLVLEVAVESQSEFIITFNKKDFKGIESFGIMAVTPQEFMTKRDMI